MGGQFVLASMLLSGDQLVDWSANVGRVGALTMVPLLITTNGIHAFKFVRMRILVAMVEPFQTVGRTLVWRK